MPHTPFRGTIPHLGQHLHRKLATTPTSRSRVQRLLSSGWNLYAHPILHIPSDNGMVVKPILGHTYIGQIIVAAEVSLKKSIEGQTNSLLGLRWNNIMHQI